MKLAGLGLQLKDSPPGFDPGAAAADYGADTWSDGSDLPVGDDGHDYAETEQL
jgi:DNA-directed RNA polymerase subunit alpha